MSDLPENVDLRFLAVQLQRIEGRVGGGEGRIGSLESAMNERFQRVEAEIDRAQADISETKPFAREVLVRLTLIEKRLSAVERV